MIEQSYIHPNADTILDDVKTILSYSSKGKTYWEANKNPITVIKNPLPQAFVAPQGHIYLCIPALQQKGRVEQTIDIIGAFAEINIKGDKSTPDLTKLEDDDTLIANHMRNVEVMLKAFEVVQELDDAGYDAVKEVRLMGIGKIWQAWKTGADLETCANIYWEVFDNEENEGNE